MFRKFRSGAVNPRQPTGMGWDVAGEFVDHALSGAKGRDQRPEIDRLLKTVNGDPNPPLHGDALFSGMKNASRQKAQEPGHGQAAVFCSLA